MAIVDTYTVVGRGEGAPDYASMVTASRDRGGLYLSERQTLEIFGCVFTAIASPFAWVLPPLAIGATANLIDNMTGVVMPFTVPIGYSMSIITIGAGVTQDIINYGYVDGFLATNLGVISSGTPAYENAVVGMTTETLDSTGAAAHTVNVTITNLGGAALTGGIEVVAILESIATPPLPIIKVIRCKYCGYEKSASVGETVLVCPKCGKKTIVFAFNQFKESK